MLLFLNAILLAQFTMSGSIHFTEWPQNTIGIIGDDMELTCSFGDWISEDLRWVKLSPIPYNISLNYTVYNESHYVVGDSGTGVYNLQIMNTNEEDAGDYSCEAIGNEVLQSSAKLFLVDKRPTCAVDPAGESVKAGESTKFSCSINEAATPLELVWRENGDTVASQGNSLLREYTKTFDRSENGAELACGLEHSTVSEPLLCEETFTMDVQYLPSVTVTVRNGSTTGHVIEGGYFSVECVVVLESNPECDSFTWLVNGKTISSDQRLEFNGIHRSQGGYYKCRGIVRFYDGSDDHGESLPGLTISVEYPPDVQTEQRVERREGQSAALSCTPTANPNVDTVGWILLNGDKKSGRTLSFTDLTRDMSGYYTCEASNTFYDGSIGTGSSRTYLDVHFGPSVQRYKSDDTVKADIGSTAILACAMTANPTPSFTWQKSGRDIDSTFEEITEGTTTTSVFTISSVTKSDYGDYTCTASNVVSSDICKIKLVQKGLSASTKAIIGVVCVLIIIIGIGAAIGYYIYRRRKYTQNQQSNGGQEEELRYENIEENDRGNSEEKGGYEEFEFKQEGQVKGDDQGQYQPLDFTRSEQDSTYMSLEAKFKSLKKPVSGTTNKYMTADELSRTFPREHISMLNVIGEGSFGRVTKATATDIADKEGKTVVAVKTVKNKSSDDYKKKLDLELDILKCIGTHKNVVCLLGCCTQAEPVYIIMEFMTQGNLQKYLRDYRSEKTGVYANADSKSWVIQGKDLISFASQIASGMEYLASKSFVHGELTARSILVTDDHRMCKISNIGLRGDTNIEKKRLKETRLPIRWFAPETLKSGEYSSVSDVWSFGIVLWEISTLGFTPYPNGESVGKVKEFIKKGFRMKRPTYCDVKLYSVMKKCWAENKTERPSFPKLVIELDSMAKSSEIYIDVQKACADSPKYIKASTANEKC
ncbi:fibroblast growth factor receptor homolog 1-like [Ptychodera flava]|uniref:fibroblast growth factor receptor homolog 1-like n=1 Tax=Ptychodera flava TaxID=63121 RepID=UPI00396A3C7C